MDDKNTRKLQTKMMGIEALIPYARNARTHSDAQVAQIAASIREFGWTNPVLIDGENTIIAGHGRVLAARQLGQKNVPTIKIDDMTEAQRRAYILADNALAQQAGWDMDMLAVEIDELQELGFDTDLIGLDVDFEIDDSNKTGSEGLTDDDDAPEPQEAEVSKTGDVWLCGEHRVMCGDSTSEADMLTLMNGEKAQLLHADPPYGMGKEAEGVVNDNLYAGKLDAFQMSWWRVARPFIEDNASAYIWGTAPDLWRLWYCGGLRESEQLTLRNEIVWDKSHTQGMGSEAGRSYPVASERCLFFMVGVQGFNNNSDNYWEGFEPIRAYLVEQRDKASLSSAEVSSIVGATTASHWFSKSQWLFPRKEQYEALQAYVKKSAFSKSYDLFEREYEGLKKQHDAVKQDFYKTRAYFDNTHQNMTDVWASGRVIGEDRWGHATPKPVDMMERVMRSSLPENGLCIEPFGGSGSTLMGCEKTKRRCNTMELQPKYCDVIVRRWQEFTGKKATLENTTEPFDVVQGQRVGVDNARGKG